MRIVHLCAKRFQGGEAPLRDSEISEKLEVPIRLVRQLLFNLVNCHLLSEVRVEGSSKVIAYQPARAVDELKICEIISAMEHNGINSIPVTESDELKELERRLKSLEEEMDRSSQNVAITQI